MNFRNAVIVDGVRSPFSWGGRGMFEATRLDEVAAKVVRALMERNPKVKPTLIEDFGIGNAGNTSDLVLLGGISRLAGLPAETTNFFSNRQCGSSMETMQRIAMAIMVGAMDCGISLGVERMGRTIGGGREGGPPPNRVTGMNPKVFEKSKLQRDMAEDHYNYFSVPIPDEILDGPPLQPMVQTAQNVVDMYDITREELDAFTVRSHQKLTAAYAAGIYKDEVIPLEVEKPVFNDKKEWVPEEKGAMVLFDRDECIRPGCNMEDLGKMNPVKGQIMGMGPVPATFKAMKHAGITADQIDRVEFNEAFACQVVASLKELKIPEDRVNVNGGSLGIGHPLGATGARLVLTVAKELRRSGKRYGLATQCIGAGEGISTIIEALN